MWTSDCARAAATRVGDGTLLRGRRPAHRCVAFLPITDSPIAAPVPSGQSDACVSQRRPEDQTDCSIRALESDQIHTPSRRTDADYVMVWEEELGGEEEASAEQSTRNERFRARFETGLACEGLEFERVRPPCPPLLCAYNRPAHSFSSRAT